MAVAQAYGLDLERSGREAIVSTFRRKLPRQLPSRWTEVTHARALQPRADLIQKADASQT